MNLPALRHVGSSRTRDSTQVPCISRQILNYCAATGASFKKRKKYSFGCTVSWTQHVGSISPTRDWTRVPRIGSAASQPLAHQGSPRNLLFSGRQRGPWGREVASQGGGDVAVTSIPLGSNPSSGPYRSREGPGLLDGPQGTDHGRREIWMLGACVRSVG